MTIALFGYGSLLFKPELADRVLGFVPARLPGYRRAFNKRSISRSCPKAESFDAFDDTPPRFLRNGIYRSLVLGTVESPGDAIVGKLVVYPAAVSERLLELTDLREGYDPDDLPSSGYLRVEVDTRLEASFELRRCWTYLTNADAGLELVLPRSTPLDVRAKVLINATPREPRSRDPRQESRGLYYLEGVRAQLREAGIIDSDLEALAGALRALKGPGPAGLWVEAVAPPVVGTSR